MVLLLRDSEKAEILAGLKSLENSFTAFHHNFRQSLKDIDSRIATLTNTTSLPPLSLPPQPTSPTQPTFDDLLKNLEIVMSNTNNSKHNVVRIAPTEPSSTETLPETTLHSASLLLPSNPHHRLSISESECHCYPSWDMTASREKSENYSYPASHYTDPAPSRCLYIGHTEPILRVFYGRAIIPWVEEPPGFLFLHSSVFYFCTTGGICLAPLTSFGWNLDVFCECIRALEQRPGVVLLYEDEETEMIHLIPLVNEDNSSFIGILTRASPEGLRTVREKPDLALVMCDEDDISPRSFTTNVVAAAPTLYCKEALEKSATARAVLNTDQADAAIGDASYEDVLECYHALAELLLLKPYHVLIESTRVIGKLIKKEALLKSFPDFGDRLPTTIQGANSTSIAIITTDLVSKSVAIESELRGTQVGVGGMSKGSGIIHSNMAKMFGVVTTDASITSEVWRIMVRVAVNRSFNQIIVDGDTSTNDCVIVLANVLLGANTIASLDNFNAQHLQTCLDAIMQGLAKSIVWDGEGAACLIKVQVIEADTEAEAAKVARSVASSSLTKAAVYSRDPSWGRIACDAGYAVISFDPSELQISLGDFLLMDKGQPLPFDRIGASNYLRKTGEKHGIDVIQISIGDDWGTGKIAMLYWPIPNVLYVEGYALDRFAEGIWALETVHQNKVGLVLDSRIEEDLCLCHLQVEKWVDPKTGQSTGRISHHDSLLRAVGTLVERSGVNAVAIVARFPDDDTDDDVYDYRQGKGIDLLAGIEAVISHLVVHKFGIPCAHAPALLPFPLNPSLCPKSAAEETEYTFLPCVLAGLSNAPQYSSHFAITMNQSPP